MADICGAIKQENHTDKADLISRLGRMADAMEAGDPRAASWGAAIRKAARRIEELEAALVDARLFVDLLRTHWSNWHDDPKQVAEADDCLRQIDATLQPKEQQP